MVIFLIAQAVDLCTHISEVPSCLSVFLPPGAEQCKFMSAAAPNSLVLNILSVCVHSVWGSTVYHRQYEPLWHHRRGDTSCGPRERKWHRWSSEKPNRCLLCNKHRLLTDNRQRGSIIVLIDFWHQNAAVTPQPAENTSAVTGRYPTAGEAASRPPLCFCMFSRRLGGFSKSRVTSFFG